MNLNLREFDAYFHLFAGILFLYSGIESFRTTLDDKIIDLILDQYKDNRKLNVEIKYKQSALKTEFKKKSKSPGESVEELNQKKERKNALNKKLSDAIADYLAQEKNLYKKCQEEVNDIHQYRLKSIFISTFLYCLFILIWGGLEQSVLASSHPRETSLSNNFLAFLNIALLYNFFMYLRSVFAQCKKKVNNVLVILICIAIFIILFSFCNWCPLNTNHEFFSPYFNIIIALLIPLSPFVFSYYAVRNRISPFSKEMEVILKGTTKRLDGISEAQSVLAGLK